MSIPKLIHYCWFGKNNKSESILKYMETWDKLKDYRIIEWNENNFDIESNPFLKFAYEHKKWAFVSDYVRLSVLNEYGGIYLDTDVEIKKSFDELLGDKMFLGLIYDCSIGTAVIGAIPHHPIVQDLLKLYDRSSFEYADNKIKIKFKEFEKYQTNNNNDLFTVYFIENVEEFKLCNRNQKLKNVSVYKKEYFERKTFNSDINFSIHHCYGSWYKDNPNKRSNIAKFINFFIGDVLYDKLICYLKKRKLPYYNTYIKDNKIN